MMKISSRISDISILLFLSISTLLSQQDITLEGIWKNGEYSSKGVSGFRFSEDETHYTQLIDNRIEKMNIISGNRVSTLFDGATYKGLNGFSGTIDDYALNDGESKILIVSGQEKIYRRSTRSFGYIFDVESRSLMRVFERGKISNAQFSPNGKKIAFVHQNNLYYKDLENNSTTQVTNDGLNNAVINGSTDWVYEEEFGFARAFEWSGDSEKIAFIRFDETQVLEFQMTNYKSNLYPEYVRFKYPKVGERNSAVNVFIFHLNNKNQVRADLGNLEDHYVPRIRWTDDDNKVSVIKLNRHQNQLQLFSVDARNGKSEIILEETNKYYIDIDDDLRFLENGRQFIWSSEKDGFNRLYLYDMKGQEIRSLSPPNVDVQQFYGVDEDRDLAYYQSSEPSPLERRVYGVDIRNGQRMLVTDLQGVSSVEFSPSYTYFIWESSSINEPPVFRLCQNNGNSIRTLEENSELRSLQSSGNVQHVEFFQFTTSENVELNGYMIKPDNFNPNRRYPVFMFVYGGPGSQMATDQWKGLRYWWFQHLARNGYLVACVDNRGTGSRGEEFKKMTYLKLGHYETIDQIEAARYLGSLPFTDANRIGIFGWSYGGYMSSLCILKGADVFKTGIAVAPVTNWKWYDTIYTERFMRTEEENAEGYRDNAPVHFADRLTGNYLLIHGMSDDNVHFQHTAEMARALIEAGKSFDIEIYPNRAHGISDEKARFHVYSKITDFIYKNL